MENSAYREDILPYRVRSIGLAWKAFAFILLALVVVGVIGYLNQFLIGDYVTGMRDIGTGGGASWGLYIIFLEYFIGVGFAGVTMAVLIRFFNLKKLQAISRIGVVLTIISIPLGGLAVMADLGQPERGVVNIIQFVSPHSPFFGDFTLVIAGSLIASLLYLFLTGRADAAICAREPSRLQWFYKLWAIGYKGTPQESARHSTVLRWLGLMIIPLLIVAQSTLGSVFGIQGGRPGWYGAIQAPLAITIAAVSGIGFIIMIAGVLRNTLNLKQQLNPAIFRWLGNVLWFLVSGYLFLMVLEMLAANYAGPSADAAVSGQLLTGEYAGVFWGGSALMVLAFLLLFAQFAFGRYSIGLTVLAGGLVNVGAIAKRFFTVVPSQSVGTALPYLHGYYWPTWVEYAVVLGIFALGVLVYAVFVKIFPITEITDNS
jgi:Ni/Fe-hydrogenase subunit HybB-like protein